MARSPPGPRLTGTNQGKAGLRVDDGTVDVRGVNWITVTAGTLTDDGGGHVSITTGGGGGSALTVKESDGTPTVLNSRGQYRHRCWTSRRASIGG